MAQAIHIYPVDLGDVFLGDVFTCNLPSGAKIVRAEYAAIQNPSGGIVGADMKPIQAGTMKLMLFVLFDPDAAMREYTVKMVGEDCPIEGMNYCTSTFHSQYGFTHIFQSE